MQITAKPLLFVFLIIVLIQFFGFIIWRQWKGRYYETYLSSPIVSKSDTRSYQQIQLPNGLKVMLVHDPNAESAAAALNVKTGYFWDPDEHPGIAHFVEHLLFMGTEKYPRESEYMDFISEHGGSCNAFTMMENTCFLFSVDANFLEPALDRFAQFFTHPLFSNSSVDREKNAVHSEYLLYKKQDFRRSFGLMSYLANPEHPFHKFNVGSRETLSCKDGDSHMRDIVIQFYRRYYSSDRMSVAILGKEPLDVLIAFAREKFSEVPQVEVNPDYAWTSVHPVSEQVRGSITWFETIQFTRLIQLIWTLPDQISLYKSKSGEFLADLVGNDSTGGLLTLLKEKGWATSVGSGLQRHFTGSSIFILEVTLTMAGLLNHDSVLAEIYSYLNFLKSKDIERDIRPIFHEFSQARRTLFDTQSKYLASAYVSMLSSSLHLYPASEIISGPILADYFDSASYNSLLHQYLVPENCQVFIWSNENSRKCDPSKDVDCIPSDQLVIQYDQMEPWFEVPFTTKPMDTDRITFLKNVIGESFTLPLTNHFIPSDLSLVTSKAPKPQLPTEILKNVWFKPDDTFAVPKGQVLLKILNPRLSSIRQYTLATLWNQILVDHLVSRLYPAVQVGYSYATRVDLFSMIISIFGYSEKIFLLLEEVLDGVLMKGWAPSRASFAAQKSLLISNIENIAKYPPFILASYFLNTGLGQSTIGMNTMKAALNTIELEDLSSLDSIFSMDDLFGIQAAVLGNFKATQVSNFFSTNLTLKLAEAGLSHTFEYTGQSSQMVVKLRPSTAVIFHHKSEDVNSCLLAYFQIGAHNVDLDTAYSMLYANILTTSFFSELRSQESLGYVVNLSMRRVSNINGIQFLVQSTSNPGEIYQKMDAFIRRSAEYIEELSPEKFSSFVSSVKFTLLEQPVNLEGEFLSMLQSIMVEDRAVRFNTSEPLAEIVSKADQGQLAEWARGRLIDRLSRRMALVAIFGASSTEHENEFEHLVSENELHKPISIDGFDDPLIEAWKQMNGEYYDFVRL